MHSDLNRSMVKYIHSCHVSEALLLGSADDTNKTEILTERNMPHLLIQSY